MILYFIKAALGNETPDLFKNQLHFGYGINYKYNGKLYHNLDRVWVVHRLVIPQIKDLNSLPQFPEQVDCYPYVVDKYKKTSDNLARKSVVTKICELGMPQYKLLKQQAVYLKNQVDRIVRDELQHALHSFVPVSHLEYSRTKRALTPTPGELLVNDSLHEMHIPRNRTERWLGAVLSAALPAVGKLATIAVEHLGSYLQGRRNKAITKALQKMDRNITLTRNMMHQLEKDFVLYGEYDTNSTVSIVKMLDSLDNRSSTIEKWLEGHSKIWVQNFYETISGPLIYSHLTQLYLASLRERYIRLYEALNTELKLLLRSIAILSKGYLPPQLFPPSTLVGISQKSLAIIQAKNPGYVLALTHITDYYDMRLVTFGLDDQGRLVVCFPIFVKEHKKEPMTLYQIETVKVPINDENTKADSYTEVAISKPYLASNKDYYIQLMIQELVMCKKIRSIYYCEELFLVKHKTKHSCESAIFYALSRETIIQNCQFNYFYNITVIPSILDGGSEIVLANMLSSKRLICAYEQGLAKPLPTSSYALVSRDILCHCHLQAGLTYVLKSITTCNMSSTPIFYYTVNLAFMDYFYSFWNNDSLSHIPLKPTLEETVLPIGMEDYTKDPFYRVYSSEHDQNPTNLQELSNLAHDKQEFQRNRNKLFSKEKAELEPRVTETPISKSSFLFSAIFHIYAMTGSTIAILWTIPYIIFAIKQRKMKSLVTAMAMHNVRAIEAAALNTEGTPESLKMLNVPEDDTTRLVCQDPWVSFVLTAVTIIGLVMCLYKHCKHYTLVKGHKFACICHIHLIVSGTTRYVPLKIGQYIGSPFLFTYNQTPQTDQVILKRQCLWDHIHINWKDEKVQFKDKAMALREHLNVPLIDKIRLRYIISREHQIMYMIRQGDTWYNLKQI